MSQQKSICEGKKSTFITVPRLLRPNDMTGRRPTEVFAHAPRVPHDHRTRRAIINVAMLCAVDIQHVQCHPVVTKIGDERDLRSASVSNDPGDRAVGNLTVLPPEKKIAGRCRRSG
jgi:hypothetical protein